MPKLSKQQKQILDIFDMLSKSTTGAPPKSGKKKAGAPKDEEEGTSAKKPRPDFSPAQKALQKQADEAHQLAMQSLKDEGIPHSLIAYLSHDCFELWKSKNADKTEMQTGDTISLKAWEIPLSDDGKTLTDIAEMYKACAYEIVAGINKFASLDKEVTRKQKQEINDAFCKIFKVTAKGKGKKKVADPAMNRAVSNLQGFLVHPEECNRWRDILAASGNTQDAVKDMLEKTTELSTLTNNIRAERRTLYAKKLDDLSVNKESLAKYILDLSNQNPAVADKLKPRAGTGAAKAPSFGRLGNTKEDLQRALDQFDYA